MKNNSSTICHRFSQWYFLLCGCLCILVTLLPWWPNHDILIIPKYALLFGPRWWLLLLVVALFAFWRQFSKTQQFLSPLLLIFTLNYLDFQLPKVGGYYSRAPNNADITILSANVGGGGGAKTDLNYITGTLQPDIILLQEAGRVGLAEHFAGYQFKECVSGLCIASKFPFKQLETLGRKHFGGWGKYAVFYQVQTEAGLISLANVHFETPRSVITGLIYRSFNVEQAKTIDSIRRLQAEQLGLWSKTKAHSLVIGDFNMPVDENLYQDNFAHLNNAIDTTGFGFYATKHTAWHGVRIDHVLYSNDLQLIAVEVVKTLSGDHRPVLTRLAIKG